MGYFVYPYSITRSFFVRIGTIGRFCITSSLEYFGFVAMKDYAYFYAFYTSGIVRLIRGIILLGILGTIGIGLFNQTPLISLRFPLIIFAWFLMFETFFHFKLSRIVPWTPIDSNTLDKTNSFTLKALSLLVSCPNTSAILHKFYKNPPIQFILQKAELKQSEIPIVEIPQETLIASSFDLAKKVGGTYGTSIDVFGAYLLLIENEKKVLFTKELKIDDFMHILQWARFDFQNEEKHHLSKVTFGGEGIGEEMVYGWTIETQKYMNDWTRKLIGKPVLIGRTEEYKKTVEGLSKAENNNVLLVGEPGVGRTSLLTYLAYQSYTGELQGKLLHKHFYELLAGSLLAGVTDTGILEQRLKDVIEELKHAGNVILYIPDFENILGASTFHLDLSGILLPYLKDGTLCIIATISTGNYKLFFETRTEIVNVFETIRLSEPDRTTAIQMLMEQGSIVEKKYRVVLTYQAIVASVDLAKKYLSYKSLPGSAMLLLSDTANSIRLAKKTIVEKNDVIKKTEEITHVAVAVPQLGEKDLLLNLEQELHKRVIGQDAAILAISSAMRRIRTGLVAQNKPTSFLFLGPTGVGKTETAKAFASIYFGSEDKMIRLDMSEYTGESGVKRLLGAPPGEGPERGELTDKVYDNPFSLVLLDEFEKADIKILDLFLQIFEDGRLTDNKGRTVSFVNTIIVATSNAGSEFIREHISDTASQVISKNLMEFLQMQKIFKPELLNRFDAIVMFRPLTEEEILQVVGLLLRDVEGKMKEKEITIVFTDEVKKTIAQKGYDIQFGARPLRRYIQDNVEDLLSQKLLKDEIKRGDSITITLDPVGTFAITS